MEIRQYTRFGVFCGDILPGALSVMLAFAAATLIGVFTGMGIPFMQMAGAGFALVLVIILVLLAWRARSHTLESVTPILQGVAARIILAREGLYTKMRRGAYRLHPWSSLLLDRVEPGRLRIVLRDGSTTIHLRARPGTGRGRPCYEELREAVIRLLPAGNRIPRPRRVVGLWLRAAVLLALCAMVVLFLAGFGHQYLRERSTGQPGDGRCDLCGESLSLFFTRVVAIRDGQPVHEYCEFHGTALYALYPSMAWEALISPLPPGTGPSRYPAIITKGVFIRALLVWGLIASVGLAVVPVAMPRSWAFRF
ncbi:MAG: hypothetical protein RDU89_11570 [bacterium]|nr:hypothetical protein [bacterium]